MYDDVQGATEDPPEPEQDLYDDVGGPEEPEQAIYDDATGDPEEPEQAIYDDATGGDVSSPSTSRVFADVVVVVSFVWTCWLATPPSTSLLLVAEP